VCFGQLLRACVLVGSWFCFGHFTGTTHYFLPILTVLRAISNQALMRLISAMQADCAFGIQSILLGNT
jgi:hypothetical protein